MEQYFQQPTALFQGYGINPAYATPAYMANFRPAYAQEGFVENPYADQITGNNRRLRDRILPFPFNNNSTYATDPLSYNASLSYEFANDGMDAATWAAQRVGTPLAAWWAMNKMMNIKTAAPAGSYAARAAQFNAGAEALFSGRGMAGARTAFAGAAGTQTFAGRMGSVLGRGFGNFAGRAISGGARVIGLGGMASGAGAAMGGAGAVAGGVLGTFALPFAAAIGASKLAEEALFDPYIAIRRGEDALLANTANTFVGGSSLTPSGRFGTSHEHAEKLSRALVDSATQDFAFDEQDFNIMADYGMRAGLMNDIGNLNVEDMKRRVEGMADTVKMIMAVANTASVKEAIEYMGRIKGAGVSDPSVANRVMASLGLSSAQSGVSVEQLMNTIGNQGQLMFQRSGLLPVLGQTAAASVHAGFANAYKAGILSTENLAALGGIEGATQNTVEGSLGLLNSPLADMYLMTDRRFSDNPVDAIASFGQRSATDPYSMAGDMALNRDVYASERIAEDGLDRSALDAVLSQAFLKRHMLMDDSGEKYDATKLAGFMRRDLGMSDMQTRAMMTQYQSYIDPDAQSRRDASNDATLSRIAAQSANQHGALLYNTAPGRAWLGLRGIGKDIKEDVFNPIGGFFTELKADFSDGADRMINKLSGINSPLDVPIYRTEKDEDGNRQMNKYSIEGLRTAAYYGEPDVDQRNIVENDWGIKRQLISDSSKSKYTAPLLRGLLSSMQAEGEQGDLAREIMEALQSGNDVDNFAGKLVKLDQLSGNNVLNVTNHDNALEVAKMMDEWRDTGLLRVNKDEVATSDKARERAQATLYDAIYGSNHRRKMEDWYGADTYWSATAEMTGLQTSLTSPASQSATQSEIRSLSEVGRQLFNSHFREDGDRKVTSAIQEILDMDGMKAAASKKEDQRTDADNELIDRLEAVSSLTGMKLDDLLQAAAGGDTSTKYYEVMEKAKDDDITDTFLDNVSDAYKDNPEAVMDMIAGDDEAKRNAMAKLSDNFWENLSSTSMDIFRNFFSTADEQSQENNRVDGMAETIGENISGLSSAVKDFKGVTDSMKSFGDSMNQSSRNIDSAAGKFERAADRIERSADALERASQTTPTTPRVPTPNIGAGRSAGF